MALTINTKIINDADNYSLDAKNVKGTYVAVDTIIERNNLPAATIIAGSLCYVTQEDKYYRYTGTQWVEAQFGGGDVTDVKVDGTSVLDSEGVANIDLATPLSGKEAIANKTTTITSSSTDIEYPSAKAVYDYHDETKQDKLIDQSTQQDKYLHTVQGAGGIELEWADVSAGGTVQDVTINGTSIVSGGTAAIPKASSSDLGVVKINSTNGVNIDNTGTLLIWEASENEIIAKTSYKKPLSPAMLNVAVREGLGNNSLTWTDQYKSNARTTIGAGTVSSLTDLSITATASEVNMLSGTTEYTTAEIDTLWESIV